MKTLSKILPGLVLGVLVLDSALLNAEGQPQAMSANAEVEAQVTAHLAEQLQAALAQPRAVRAPRIAAVEVIDPTYIVVEASRLPAQETLAGAAIRTAQADL